MLSKLKGYMPFKRRAGNKNFKKDKISVLGYIDSRDVMDLLDSVVGPENRQSKFYELKGSLFCEIGIDVDRGGKSWVWKGDCGTESNIEAQKGEASDAFKRAAIHRGIGRFLYTLPTIRIDCDGKNPVYKDGTRIWDITEYVRKEYKEVLNKRFKEQYGNKETTDLFD